MTWLPDDTPDTQKNTAVLVAKLWEVICGEVSICGPVHHSTENTCQNPAKMRGTVQASESVNEVSLGAKNLLGDQLLQETLLVGLTAYVPYCTRIAFLRLSIASPPWWPSFLGHGSASIAVFEAVTFEFRSANQ